MVTDRYKSENQGKTPEEREATKKRLKKNQATYEMRKKKRSF